MEKEIKKEAGSKQDGQKLRIDLIPWDAVLGAATAFTHGAIRYGERNWEKGLSWSRFLGSLLRHLFAWWYGEDRDGDSGLCHIDQACFAILALSHYAKNGTGNDDRPYDENDGYCNAEKTIRKYMTDWVAGKKVWQDHVEMNDSKKIQIKHNESNNDQMADILKNTEFTKTGQVIDKT